MKKALRRIFRRGGKTQHSVSPLRDLQPEGSFDLRRIGSSYGGWVIAHHPALYGRSFLSAGAGEDISFDVEFSTVYGMKGIIVDPTPRAIVHVEEVLQRVGQRRTEPYCLGGDQPVSTYDLSGLKHDSITFLPDALWIDDEGVDFFPPKEEKNVSHSIFLKRGSNQTPSVRVGSVSPRSLAQKVDPSEILLIKLDIEGAEVDVIAPLLESFPAMQQFLIEFDVEKTQRSDRYELVQQSLDDLSSAGFVLAHSSGRNLLFVNRNAT